MSNDYDAVILRTFLQTAKNATHTSSFSEDFSAHNNGANVRVGFKSKAREPIAKRKRV